VSQTGITFGTIVLAFFVYVTTKGELGKYLAVFGL
jgi:hypothetical protein